jgi:hypothetical protein
VKFEVRSPKCEVQKGTGQSGEEQARQPALQERECISLDYRIL